MVCKRELVAKVAEGYRYYNHHETILNMQWPRDS